MRYSLAMLYDRIGRQEDARPHAELALEIALNNIGFGLQDQEDMCKLVDKLTVGH